MASRLKKCIKLFSFAVVVVYREKDENRVSIVTMKEKEKKNIRKWKEWCSGLVEEGVFFKNTNPLMGQKKKKALPKKRFRVHAHTKRTKTGGRKDS